ncbi:MAG: hypothetical protein RJB39_244 [Candidatus Parcubacteria bacterium]
MFKKIAFTSLALLLLSTQTASAEVIEVKNWTTIADISLANGAAIGSTEWFLAELPADMVKSSAKAALSDIRLIDSSNTEIPYMIVRQGDITPLLEDNNPTSGRPLRILENSLQKGPRGQDRVMVLEIPLEGKVYNGINLQVSPQSTNFRKVVNIAVSDVQLGATSPSWREIEAKPVIYNYSDRQGLFIQKTDVKFGPASSRYIRLRFEQDPNLATVGVQFTNNVVVDSVRIAYESDTAEKGASIKNYLAGTWNADTKVTEEAKVENIVQNTDKKVTEITYKVDSKTGFVGANKITLKVDNNDTNFKRQVSVLVGVQDDKGITWSAVAAGQIYRINSPVFQGEMLSVAFAPITADYIKVIVQNNNDTALKVDNHAVVEIQKVAVLFKKEDKSLVGVKLLSGNNDSITPTYEIQKTLSYFESVVPDKVIVENVKNNPLYSKTEQLVAFGEKYKWLLNTVLIIFVMGIILLAVRWTRIHPAKEVLSNPQQDSDLTDDTTNEN